MKNLKKKLKKNLKKNLGGIIKYLFVSIFTTFISYFIIGMTIMLLQETIIKDLFGEYYDWFQLNNVTIAYIIAIPIGLLVALMVLYGGSVDNYDSSLYLNPEVNSLLKTNKKMSENSVVSAVEEALQCPKCYSSHLISNKKGFGLGKAAVGGALVGGVGLLGGFIGSNKIKITCLKCGYSWSAGKN